MKKPLLEKLIQEIAAFDMDAAYKLHQRKDNREYSDYNNLDGVIDWEDTKEGLDYWIDIHDKLEARRKNYHPHRDLMIEFANDRNIEIEYLKDDGLWKKCEGFPSFFECDKYRKKPKITTKKTINYRFYLNNKNEIHSINELDPLPSNLKQWLGDWQKVEIEVEENDKGV